MCVFPEPTVVTTKSDLPSGESFQAANLLAQSEGVDRLQVAAVLDLVASDCIQVVNHHVADSGGLVHRLAAECGNAGPRDRRRVEESLGGIDHRG